MTYLFHYTRKLTRNDGTLEEPNVVEYFQHEAIGATDGDYDMQYAEAMKYAYNGEITVEDIPESPEEQISKLKAQLESTDYKIIKCSEAQLVGEELPYDITALHAERQALRDRINELESGGDST